MHPLFEDIARELESFLRESFQIDETDPHFTRTAHLWNDGYVDSAGVVQTIAHLEERYRVRLPEQVLEDPAFTHIDGIARLVAELVRSGARC
jgi:acyl carrier protein